MSRQELKLRSHQKGKILQTDYDFIFELDGEFQVCLTAGQIQWILASSDYASWATRWSSSSGSEIDTDKIAEFQADMVRRLMFAVVPCGECEMFRLRQNPENPCQLEQSVDAGLTWSLAFDYDLCMRMGAENPPLTRYEDEYRGHQTSYDGGTTWVDTPDNRFKSPITSNLYKDAADPRCETSAQVVEYMKEFLDVDDEQLFLAIVTFIVDLVAIILTGGAAIPLVVTLVQAFIQLGIEAFQNAMTQAEWDKFQENLYCHANDDGSWSIAAYFAIVDQLAVDHVTNAHFFLYQTMTAIGYVGLNNAGHLTYETTLNCASFECEEQCSMPASVGWKEFTIDGTDGWYLERGTQGATGVVNYEYAAPPEQEILAALCFEDTFTVDDIEFDVSYSGVNSAMKVEVQLRNSADVIIDNFVFFDNVTSSFSNIHYSTSFGGHANVKRVYFLGSKIVAGGTFQFKNMRVEIESVP